MRPRHIQDRNGYARVARRTSFGFPGRRRDRVQRMPGPRAIAPGRHSGRVPLPAPEPNATRSEEHTSELQSLMRISYAVFCLKKKKTKKNTQYLTYTCRLKTEHKTERHIQNN